MNSIIKKMIRLTIYSAVILCMLLAGAPALASSAQVQVTLPDFTITINNHQIDNATRQYPLIVYRSITYFPMTYHDARFLGLETDYSATSGFEIKKADVAGSYSDDRISGTNPRAGTARIAAFPIHVNGKHIDNSREQYPLLVYRDITYFPLTWRFAFEEFGWDYDFDSTYGLTINSYDYHGLQELLGNLYGEQKTDIVRAAADRMQSSEWLNLTLRAFSRRENRVVGILSEHVPSGNKWYQEATMTEADNYDNTRNPNITGHYLLLNDKLYNSADGRNWLAILGGDFAFPEYPDFGNMLEQFPEGVFDKTGWDDYVGWDYYAGSPCMLIMFSDELPPSRPPTDENSYISAGSINRYSFYFDLEELCLRSYWVSSWPVAINADGEPYVIPLSTVFYSAIDFDYQPVAFPVP